MGFRWRRGLGEAEDFFVTRITARLPDELVAALDGPASQPRRSRADVVRQAIDDHRDDLEDATAAIQAPQDPAEPVLDWDSLRRDLGRGPVDVPWRPKNPRRPRPGFGGWAIGSASVLVRACMRCLPSRGVRLDSGYRGGTT